MDSMDNMKMAFVALVVLAFLPCVNAQASNLFVQKSNATYSLYEDYFYVEEVIVFSYRGSGFFNDVIWLNRGNAWNISVGGDVFSYNVTGEKVTRVEFKFNNFFYGQNKTLTLSYFRSDILQAGEKTSKIEGRVLERYPWIAYNTRLKFMPQRDVQFDIIKPETERKIEGGIEVLEYEIPVMMPYSGFNVTISYANFKSLSALEMASANTMRSEADSAIKEANLSIENAKRYGYNVTQALATYNESITLLDEADELRFLSEKYSGISEYVLAYCYARDSKELAKLSKDAAMDVKDKVFLATQSALESKISDLQSGLTQQSQEIEQFQKIRDTGEQELKKGYAIALFLIVVLVLGIAMARPRTQRALKKGTVNDFRSIEGLKRKEFTGFEKKVDVVKRGVELGSKIRKLKKEREKLELGIENLRKKKVAGEIKKEIFESEMEIINRELDDIDTEIYRLEEELKKIKKVKG